MLDNGSNWAESRPDGGAMDDGGAFSASGLHSSAILASQHLNIVAFNRAESAALPLPLHMLLTTIQFLLALEALPLLSLIHI